MVDAGRTNAELWPSPWFVRYGCGAWCQLNGQPQSHHYLRMEQDNVRYIVFGAGAIGSTVGAYLRLAGRETVLVGRPDHVARIRRQGLLVRAPSETRNVSITVVSSAVDLQPFRAD